MKYLAFAIMWLISVTALASCPQLYPNNQAVAVQGTTELCNLMYSSSYDYTNRRVIAAFEVLQPGGHVIQRKDSFHADGRVSNPVYPSEYLKTGYDKGHMVPADDSVSAYQMYESFLMTNMTPQNPGLNRGEWKMLETRVRTAVEEAGVPVHVVTGALYLRPLVVNGLVVPSGYYKIVYLPSGTKSFYANNSKGAKVSEVPVSWVIAKSKIDFPLTDKQ
jgi:endonuclease G